MGSHGHRSEVCQYGTRHGGCRCPDGARFIVPIECPSPDRCAPKVESAYVPRHRRNVFPDSPSS